MKYKEKTGETSRWTNATFSGMPTYQTSPSYPSTSVLSATTKAYHLWMPDYVWYVFAYLLGFYILLRAFDFRQSLAALGAVILGLFKLFFHHHRCRTHLESDGPSLFAAHDCGYSVGL